jgi:hypothetical protein
MSKSLFYKCEKKNIKGSIIFFNKILFIDNLNSKAIQPRSKFRDSRVSYL